MPMCHDFINGFYYEDSFTGERISEMEYYRREREEELRRKGQQYILIKLCESNINGNEFDFDDYQWYFAEQEKPPQNVVILSENEYIKNEEKCSYYRKYNVNYSFFIEVEANMKLKVDKVEKIYEFFLCKIKGKGKLYTEKEFREKFLTKRL